jgi:hypothetical protein
MRFNLPIYWTETFKTKPSKTHLVGMNFYRNAHYIQQNNLKRDLSEALHKQLCSSPQHVLTRFEVEYQLYYKNPSSDPSNTIALSEKIFLDFAQEANLIKQDNVIHHLKSTWTVAGKDVTDPRVEITLKEIHD